jgi:hypothetical protein
MTKLKTKQRKEKKMINEKMIEAKENARNIYYIKQLIHT